MAGPRMMQALMGNGLIPFDPKKHTPQDVGLGGLSTEYTATEYDPEGLAFNYPTIWWDEGGNPQLMNSDDAMKQALSYEDKVGRKFPRFGDPRVGGEAARERSHEGGAYDVPLMDWKPFNSPF